MTADIEVSDDIVELVTDTENDLRAAHGYSTTAKKEDVKLTLQAAKLVQMALRVAEGATG